MDDSQTLQHLIEERLIALPPVVQRAIASSDVQEHLRGLSNTHKLHLDQWESLEHEVMMTLLGIHAIENLEGNIVNEVGVTHDIAHTLAEDISTNVFEPIRQELERQLSHPEAQVKEVSGVEAAREAALQGAAEDQATQSASATPTIQPATPPLSSPDIKVTRPSESSNYKPGETSAQRAAVHEDPYREPPV